jgi:hypothetical protein
MKTSRSSQRIMSIRLIILLATSAFFFWLWYERYLRIEFNELGRYYDAENQIVYTDTGFVWCIPAFGFLLAALTLITTRFLRSLNNSSRKRDA